MMNKQNLPILFLLFSFSLFSQKTITITGGEDAILHSLSSQRDKNFGTNQQFSANSWTFSSTPFIARSVLNFDLSNIPKGSYISDARLYLYAWDSNGGFGKHSVEDGSNACWLQRITSNWDENTVTWNTQPSTTELNQIGLPESKTADENYIYIDVTNLVQDMINDPENSFGLMLKLQTESGKRRMNFASSNHTNEALHPKISISYIEPIVADTFIVFQPDSIEGKDAVLHNLSSRKHKNFGSNPQYIANAWTVSLEPFTVRSVLGIDLTKIPNNVKLERAFLNLYPWNSNGGFESHSNESGSNACWLQRITSNWDENTVTWNTQPSITEINQVELPESNNPDDNYLIDITKLVQDMIDDPTNSFGLMLKLQDENYYRRMNFASSDHPNNKLHPKFIYYFSVKNSISEKYKDENSVETYPNPSSGVLYLKLNTNKISYEILEVNGKLVQKQSNINKLEKIDVSDLHSGIYFIRFYNKNINVVKKIIIK